jgi:hypothetical protein
MNFMLDLGPIGIMISHYVYADIPESKKKIWNPKYYLPQVFQIKCTQPFFIPRWHVIFFCQDLTQLYIFTYN